ncbi:aquaporin [Kribbella sp. NPDC000426]|uniref:MIP/aquaporin family protein n=1 Tax=Kribbella sp. NPDC000426 TaxID=3154255 RepID=UPI003329822F
MTGEPANGWHWREWGAELAGTGVLMFAVVTAKDWAVQAGQPFADLHWRIAIVAVVAGLAVVAVALSPLGRRSGAHLNPAVTLGLWWQHAVGRADLSGYVVAQTVGGVLGIAAGRAWGEDISAPPVRWALISPSPTLPLMLGVAIEAVATFVQLALVFWLLLDKRTAPWTAPAAGAMLTVSIVALATTTGAAFNPVRGLAPDLLASAYPGIWIYLVGPLIGGSMAGLLVRTVATPERPVTAKLRHDPEVPCYLACRLPHRPTGAHPTTSPAREEVS